MTLGLSLFYFPPDDDRDNCGNNFAWSSIEVGLLAHHTTETLMLRRLTDLC